MWGGEFYFLILLGFSAAMIGLVGWSVAMVATQANPKRRVQWLFTLGFMVIGFGVGGLSWLLSWPESRWAMPAWVAAGLLTGACAGNVFGRVAWVWLQPEIGSSERGTR